VAQELRRSREAYLLSLSVFQVLRTVDRVARRFLDPGDIMRTQALEGLGFFAGCSGSMAEAVLDGMARGWTGGMLERLLHSEFPDPRALDSFVPRAAGGQIRALGLPLTFHLGAGSVPGVATTSLIRALLVKSAVFMKPGLGDVALPVVFAGGLAEEDPDLAGSVAVMYWPGEDTQRTEAALGEVDLVVAYASDETVRWIRQRLPPQVPFRAYRHRLGVGLVGREALGEGRRWAEGPAWEAARTAARAVAMFDQRGCVSPHVFFVEEGGEVDPGRFAELLAGGLQEMESQLPSGPHSQEEWAAVQQLRGEGEMGEGLGSAKVFHGGEEAPWTVLYLPGGELEPSCLGRTVRVFPVKDVGEALESMSQWKAHLQTVGLSGFDNRIKEVGEALARLGVSRISRMGDVPWPDPWWHHDGTGPLRDLVLWTDLEGTRSFSSDDAEE
jgi:hypothetical protein